MRDYRVRIFDLNVTRRTEDAPFDNPGKAGDIQNIEVGATRSKPGESNAARYVLSYGVRDGIAEVRAIEPTERGNVAGTVRPEHLAHILTETDALVCVAVPEVEAVKPFSMSLRNERAKHTDGEVPRGAKPLVDPSTVEGEDGHTGRDAA